MAAILDLTHNAMSKYFPATYIAMPDIPEKTYGRHQNHESVFIFSKIISI